MARRDELIALRDELRRDGRKSVAMMPANTVEGMMLKLSGLLGWYENADELVDDIASSRVSSEEMAISTLGN